MADGLGCGEVADWLTRVRVSFVWIIMCACCLQIHMSPGRNAAHKRTVSLCEVWVRSLLVDRSRKKVAGEEEGWRMG